MAGINNNNNNAGNEADPFNNNNKELTGIQESTNDLDEVFEGTLEKIEEENKGSGGVA